MVDLKGYFQIIGSVDLFRQLWRLKPFAWKSWGPRTGKFFLLVWSKVKDFGIARLTCLRGGSTMKIAQVPHKKNKFLRALDNDSAVSILLLHVWLIQIPAIWTSWKERFGSWLSRSNWREESQSEANPKWDNKDWKEHGFDGSWSFPQNGLTAWHASELITS